VLVAVGLNQRCAEVSDRERVATSGDALEATLAAYAAPIAPDALGPEAIAATMRARRRRLVLVDLAVPRAIPAATGRVEDVYLCDVDDLDRVTRASLDERASAAGVAGGIVAEEAARWSRSEAERRAAPLIHELRSRARAIAREEVLRTLRRLGEDPELARRLDAMAGSIVAKLLHAPSTRLRRAACDGGEGEALVAAAARIFDLPPDRRTGAA
jgi:glutamyl-tRNA reductase